MFNEHLISNDWHKFDDFCLRKVPGLPTGFRTIDKLIIGLPGLVTVMGQPKCCKSTLALNVAIHSARRGHPVIFIDKENGLQRTRMRMACAISKLSHGAVETRKFRSGEEKCYKDATNEIKQLPIAYFNQLTAEDLQEAIVEAWNQHHKRVLIVADSLQSLVQDFADRRSSVDFWVYLFNDLKNKYENKVTFLMVSEKKRDSYGMASKSGGKESGAIEYKSEMVLDMYVKEEDITQIHIDCTYNRDGNSGYICALTKSDPYTYNLEDNASEVPE